MPYSNKQMLRDANGDLIPQYWDVVEQEFKPLTGSDGANDVRLTGSKVEKILSRGDIINTSLDVNLTKPEWAKGLIFGIRVRGLTGEFKDGEGWYVAIRPLIGNASEFIYANTLQSDTFTNITRGSLLFYPGAEKGEGESAAPGYFNKISSIPVPNTVRVVISLNGNFQPGEGLDGEAWIEWLI